jgi:PKD repeat protein
VLAGPFTVDEGSLITFDGSASRAAGGANIVKYEWDFNYNGQTFNLNTTGPVVSASYPDGPATATVALRVTDDRGASHIAAAQVTVRNLAPVADAGGPYAGQVGSPITLSGSATDPSPVDQTTLLYHWEFGDGATGNGPLVSHTYQQAGSYPVTLTVTDKDGGVGRATATVEISAVNQPPVAVISGPERGLVGEMLNFSAGESSDPDGHIASYAWDFGDGNIASGVNATHSYGTAGNYQVILTVTDDDGLTASAVLAVQIDAEDEEVET